MRSNRSARPNRPSRPSRSTRRGVAGAVAGLPVLVGVTHAFNGSNYGAATASLPAGTAIGDLLVVCASSCNNGTPNISAPAGLTTTAFGSAFMLGQMGYGILASVPASVTANSSKGTGIIVSVWRGASSVTVGTPNTTGGVTSTNVPIADGDNIGLVHLIKGNYTLEPTVSAPGIRVGGAAGSILSHSLGQHPDQSAGRSVTFTTPHSITSAYLPFAING